MFILLHSVTIVVSTMVEKIEIPRDAPPVRSIKEAIQYYLSIVLYLMPLSENNTIFVLFVNYAYVLARLTNKLVVSKAEPPLFPGKYDEFYELFLDDDGDFSLEKGVDFIEKVFEALERF